MTELDSAAVDKAAVAFYGPAPMVNDPLRSICREHAARVITAYLAARPTPDAAAMEREEQAFRIELDRFALCAEKASIWYPTDEYHTKRTLERDNKRQELIEMFRKAATR